MRISTRIAVPAAAAVTGATLFASVPALAENIVAEPPTSVDAAVSTQAAINSALRQESAQVTRKNEEIAEAQMRAAVVANWQQQAAAAEQAAAEQAAAEQAAAEQAAAEQAAAEQQWAYEQAVAAEMIRQAEAAAYTASAATETYSAPVATGGYSGGGAVGAAMSMIGAPYVAGGQSPSGFDCSGFVKWAYEQAGVSLPGGSYNQIGYGSAVSADALAPGDLVFYGPGGSQHVAIYIGGGQVVQASNYDTGVHVASLYYIGEPTAFRRI